MDDLNSYDSKIELPLIKDAQKTRACRDQGGTRREDEDIDIGITPVMRTESDKVLSELNEIIKPLNNA